MSFRLHLLRATIEARSPLSLCSDEEVPVEIAVQEGRERTRSGREKAQSTQVTALMRDFNDLPTIPGSSLRGVLRALYAEIHGEAEADRLFGHEDAGGLGRAGLISFSWAAVHDGSNEAVTGLRTLEGCNDEVLSILRRDAPLYRDRVALNIRHSVDEHKKFGRIAVPVGTRFSLEMSARGGEEIRALMIRVANMLRHPDLRLGGAGAAGYGRIRLVSASYHALDPGEPEDLRKLRETPPSVPLEQKLFEGNECPPPASRATRAILQLEFCDGVRVGGRMPDDAGEDAFHKQWILREEVLSYDGREDAQIKEFYPLPATAIRGPFAHRMAFHANRAAGKLIDVDEMLALDGKERNARLAEMSARPEALRHFLGHAKERQGDSNGQETGAASCLMVDDSWFEWREGAERIRNFTHVSIDRFTGGARDQTGVLFEEEMLVRPEATVTLVIPPGPDSEKDGVDGWAIDVVQSFLAALRDLTTGRLPVGARSLGICTGRVAWSGPAAAAWKKAAETAGVPCGAEAGEGAP